MKLNNLRKKIRIKDMAYNGSSQTSVGKYCACLSTSSCPLSTTVADNYTKFDRLI